MKCENITVHIFSLIVALFKIVNGKICYGAEFSEDVTACQDFVNEQMKCDTLKLGMVEGKEAELGLNGVIEVNAAIKEGTKMGVEIWKILDIGKEFLYHMEGDICTNLKNEDAPWYPMIHSMNIINCPIATDTYSVKDMSMSLNHSQEMMTHEMIGDYILKLMMSKDLEELACYELAVTVTEYEC